MVSQFKNQFKDLCEGIWLSQIPFVYLPMMKKLEKISITIQEWYDALRLPTPHRNKKKYYRKEKHKDGWKSEK
jgi:hypothetical protein